MEENRPLRKEASDNRIQVTSSWKNYNKEKMKVTIQRLEQLKNIS